MSGKMALAHAVTLAAIAFAALACAPAGHAQVQVLHAPAPLPSFEVATIKPRDPNARLMMTPPGSQNIVRYAAPARMLIAMAYDATEDRQHRVLGGPAWIDDQNSTYVIEGKIPDDLYARMQTMTGEERRRQACLMLQSLLADRFKLRVHFEMHEMPVYELTIAKVGPKLPPPNTPTPPAATPGSAEPPRPPEMGGGEVVTKTGLRIRNMSLDGMLTAPWFQLGDRPIINKTGLTGTYNLTLNWVPDIPRQAANPEGPPAPPEGQASIFTALEEELGLKLAPAKAPVEVVIIDSIEQPSDN